MSTDPEPAPDTEAEDLRTRLARVEAHAATLEAHVLDIRDQERHRSLKGLLLALGGLAASLFLPCSDEIGLYHLLLLLYGTGMEQEDPFLGITAAGVGIMLIVGCVALPFLSRPWPSALLTGFAVLVAPALFLLLPLVLSGEGGPGAGALVAFVSAIAAPVSASRVAQFPKASAEPRSTP